jgi:serine/threonine protein kinase
VNYHTVGIAEAADAISVAATGHDEEIGGLMEALSVTSQTPTIAENCEYITAASGKAGGSWESVATARTSSSGEGLSPAELEALRAENQVHFQRLMAESASQYKCSDIPEGIRASASSPAMEFWYLVEHGTPFFWDFGGRVEVGRRIGGGGQAEVYEALFDGHATEFVLKVFQRDTSLADLQRLWATDIFNSIKDEEDMVWAVSSFCRIMSGTMLKDGRFAFVMKRYWGDLRRAIDLQIVKDVKTCQNPPFPLSITVWIMYKIASGIVTLYYHGKCLHRDLKAANVLLDFDIEKYIEKGILGDNGDLDCDIADYETSEGVLGTGFWRAPEILCALKNKAKNMLSNPKIWTEKVDVYSYAMTSYEVLTGCIPFQNHAINDYDGVIGGARPPLPDYIDLEIQELVRRCWHPEPSVRPTFKKIVRELCIFITKRREVSKDLPDGERDDEALRWLENGDFYWAEYNLKERGS